MASKKKISKKTSKKSSYGKTSSKKKSKKQGVAAAAVAGRPVVMRLFVKPLNQFVDDQNKHPGIALPAAMWRMAAAASTARLVTRRNATAAEMAAKLEELLDDLYQDVAGPGAPALVKLPPSCWDEVTKIWEPGPCVAVNAIVPSPTFVLPGSPLASWRLIVGLQVVGT